MPVNFTELNEEIIACEKCPRLVAFRQQVAVEKRRAFRDCEYWGKPVPGFGDPQAQIMIVGLAPGAHGSNRTGRMFTGDDSGRFLYDSLYRHGLASQPFAVDRTDGLTLHHLFITAVGRCVPPQNKPTSAELANCRPYLEAELDLLPRLQVVVALGKIAYDAMMSILQERGLHFAKQPFAHLACVKAQERDFWLLASYHPSRQNTQTGRLTMSMFDQVWDQAVQLVRD
jgi:uracil-DNA glycosylase family 4